MLEPDDVDDEQMSGDEAKQFYYYRHMGEEATYRIGRDDTGGDGEESGGKDMEFHDDIRREKKIF